MVLEIHYEPIGRKILDDYTQAHINFHKKRPKYDFATLVHYDKTVNIPPYASNHKMKISFKIPEKKLLIWVDTHMHFRGKASSIFVINPQGIRKRIFGIEPWSVIFERPYTLMEPLVILKGSTIECINWFDNSEKNLLNPNPRKNVVEGSRLFENEMSICGIKWLVPSDDKVPYIWKDIDNSHQQF